MTHVKTLSILLTFFSHIWTWNVCATFFHLAYQWMLVFYNLPFSFSFMFWLDFRERTRLKKQCHNIFKTKNELISTVDSLFPSHVSTIIIILHHITGVDNWSKIKAENIDHGLIYYCFTILYLYCNNWCTLLFESWSFPSLDAVVFLTWATQADGYT